MAVEINWRAMRPSLRNLSAFGAGVLKFLQSGSGAVERSAQSKMREVFSVTDFGAVGDGVTDDAPAFRLAMAAIGYRAAKIHVPKPSNFYYFADTVEVSTPVTFVGDGFDPNVGYLGSAIKVASGKTAFYVTRTSTAASDGCGFRDLSIGSLGANTNETTASYTYSGFTITLASASDFANGDIILIRGGGQLIPLNRSQYYTGATTNGSPTVTISKDPPIYAGMHLQVAGAGFPISAYVVSVVGTTVTMSANATATVSAGALSFYEDFAAVIESGGGTTTLTLNCFPTNTDSFTGHKVRHFPVGIFAEARVQTQNIATHGFSRGAGVLVLANATMLNKYGQAPNANESTFTGPLYCFNNQVGVRLQGNDANNFSFDMVVGYSCTEFIFDDNSFLGGSVKGGHVSGPLGYRTTNLNGNTAFFGVYSEGGTANSFAEGTVRYGGRTGGSEANELGGMSFEAQAGRANLPPCRLYPLGSDLSVTIGDHDLGNGVLLFDNSIRGGPSNLAWMKYSSLGADGVAGVLGTYNGNDNRWIYGLTDSTHARGGNHFFVPQGILIGSGGSMANAYRQVKYATSIPVAGTFVAGDATFNTAAGIGGFAGWYTTTGGTPGTQSQFGEIVGAGGTVTQATDKSTGVTLNTRTGEITMNNAALAATTTVSFTVTSSAILATDAIVCHRKSGGTAAAYQVWVDSVAAGSFVVCVRNTTGGSLSEAVVLTFRATAGATS